MPLLGGYLSYLLKSREISIVGNIILLTQYTAAAFFLMALGALLMVLLYFVFQDGTYC